MNIIEYCLAGKGQDCMNAWMDAWVNMRAS